MPAAQEELQKLEELERNRNSECGEVVEAAEHQNFHVQEKEVILRSATIKLEALVHGGAGEELRQDPIVQKLLNRGKEQGQDQAPTDSASRPSELARGSSEAAPTATPAADASMEKPPEPRQVPPSALGGLAPAREALTSIAEEEHVGEHGQGCS